MRAIPECPTVAERTTLGVKYPITPSAIFVSIFAVIVAVMLCGDGAQLHAAKRDKVGAQITQAEALELQTQIFTALSNGDGAAFRKLLADDLVFIHLNGHSQTKAELLAQAASNKRPGRVSFKPLETEVHLYKGLAVLSGRVDVTETETAADGTTQPRLSHVRFTDVWAFRPDGWQAVLMQGTNEPEPKK